MDSGDMQPLTLFLGGDVMTGRGIDQILPNPSAPDLYERWVQHARDYVVLAERRNGAIRAPVGFGYVWGDALGVLAQRNPDLRIVNLETSVTTSGRYQPDKGIHYRMSPGNVSCLQAAGIDCCVVANNHVLDWGETGLLQTLDVLADAGIYTAGAGATREQAEAPAILHSGGTRVLVFAWGAASSGVPADWEATDTLPGISYLGSVTPARVEAIAEVIARHHRPGDVVVASLHWGGNWGYRIADAHRELAHALIDDAGVDLIYGHSSHHPLGVEVYRGKAVLYGCGDLVNDYEGIRGYEAFRSDLAFMYFPAIDRDSRQLVSLELVPMQMRRFRLNRCSAEDRHWLARRLEEQSVGFGLRVAEGEEALRLGWRGSPPRHGG